MLYFQGARIEGLVREGGSGLRVAWGNSPSPHYHTTNRIRILPLSPEGGNKHLIPARFGGSKALRTQKKEGGRGVKNRSYTPLEQHVGENRINHFLISE